MKQLLATIPEVCSILSVQRSTIYKHINLGHLRVAKIGRRTLITLESVQALVDEATALEKR